MHGYDWNDGGINNQKFAILGLFAAAVDGVNAHERSIYLPRVYSRDQHHNRDSQHDFSEVFWMDPIIDFASRWNVEIVSTPSEVVYADRIERAGWRYFFRGTNAVETLEMDKASLSLAADFFRCLQPKITSSRHFQSLASGLFRDHEITVATQLRIEEDWAHHSEYHVKPSAEPNEEFYATADRIIQKVAGTFEKKPRRIFVTCDENYIFSPKWTIAEEVRLKTGVDIVFKSDILAPETFNELRPIDASLIDFELVKLAKIFVGLSRSTFANLATFERFAGAYSDRQSDYVYNLPGDVCGLRTDIGKRSNPIEACA